jgi:hypothetical protein
MSRAKYTTWYILRVPKIPACLKKCFRFLSVWMPLSISWQPWPHFTRQEVPDIQILLVCFQLISELRDNEDVFAGRDVVELPGEGPGKYWWKFKRLESRNGKIRATHRIRGSDPVQTILSISGSSIISLSLPERTIKFPSGNSGCETFGFQSGNEGFFVLARKSRYCAEAYTGTPHKQARGLTQSGRKRTVSG